MNDYNQKLQELLEIQTEPIKQYKLSENERVWVRKVGKTIPQWRYKLLGVATKLFNLKVLTPIPNYGGSIAIEIEANRLITLAQNEIPVPQILAKSTDGLMMSSVGKYSLLYYLENNQFNQLEYWKLGLDAIFDVHHKSQYLSQAFARNIIFDEYKTIFFIDFEDDPAELLTLEECHCRDYLCYLQSTADLLKSFNNLNEAAEILKEHMNKLTPNLVSNIKKSLRPIMWMRIFSSERWGSDTLRLASMASLFKKLNELSE